MLSRDMWKADIYVELVYSIYWWNICFKTIRKTTLWNLELLLQVLLCIFSKKHEYSKEEFMQTPKAKFEYLQKRVSLCPNSEGKIWVKVLCRDIYTISVNDQLTQTFFAIEVCWSLHVLIREEILKFRSAMCLTFENFGQDFGESTVCCSF